LIEIESDLHSSSSFERSLRLSEYIRSGGVHLLSFYCVDTIGRVSSRNDFSVSILGPTPTPCPCCGIGKIVWNVSDSVLGVAVSNVYGDQSMTFSEFHSRLRIPSNVKVDFDIKPITSNMIVVLYRLTNFAVSDQIVDFSVDVNPQIAGNPFNLFSARLDRDVGISTSYNGYIMTLITGEHPFVRNVSTLWFGPYDQNFSNFWASTADSNFSGQTIIALSWQNLIIPSKGSISVSIIVKSGEYYDCSPILLTLNVPSVIDLNDLCLISGSISNSDELITHSLFLIVDDNTSSISEISTFLSPSFEISIPTASLNLSLGLHRLSFLALNCLGCLSLPVSILSTVVTHSPDPTHTTESSFSSSTFPTVIVIVVSCIAAIAIIIFAVWFLCRHRRQVSEDSPDHALTSSFL
jgi:hypothetical protein